MGSRAVSWSREEIDGIAGGWSRSDELRLGEVEFDSGDLAQEETNRKPRIGSVFNDVAELRSRSSLQDLRGSDANGTESARFRQDFEDLMVLRSILLTIHYISWYQNLELVKIDGLWKKVGYRR
ncbi:uncharacterized protein LOC114581319 [Dendrobium catenatum]|uniref:uncharacterized protein LOC114581319 n=1 Tax=Dendrobium catenatum TaxID=906689 RepID=UPI0010A04A1D|nr:uncharacterized protein LOC114581319 [Dendrobium catenatum]